MVYNKFTLTRVKQKLGIANRILNFLPKTFPIFSVFTQWLNKLADVEGVAIGTEKAKSELIVMPVVKELKRHNNWQRCSVAIFYLCDDFQFFGGVNFIISFHFVILIQYFEK